MHLAKNTYTFKRMASILKVKAQGESALWGGGFCFKQENVPFFGYILGTVFL